MKKSIAILLSMCLIFGLFTACGGTAPAAEASASAPAPQEEAASAGTPAEEAQPEPAAEAEPEEISAQEIAEEPEPEIVHLVEFPIEESFSISVSQTTFPLSKCTYTIHVRPSSSMKSELSMPRRSRIGFFSA